VIDIETRQRALLLADHAKELSPKVRHLVAEAIGNTLNRLCDEEELSYQQLLDIRGEIRGAFAFSRAISSAITSGEILEQEEA
jgi:hypothetical protein